MASKHIIFTMDIDAFFAQVEENKNPDLKDQPVAIGMKLNNKGIVSTCNYAARDYGIHSGMPVYKALKLCPSLKLIKPNFGQYQNYSNEVFEICKNMSDDINPASIDEAYLNVTNKIKGENYFEYAKKIQDKIYKETGLTTSFGISENKELSKMASGMNKPFGIETLFQNEIEEKLWPLPIGKLYFVGPSTTKKFNSLDIMTIGDLAKVEIGSAKYLDIKDMLGIKAEYYHDLANGEGSIEFEVTQKANKSVSYSKTFQVDMFNYEDVKLALKAIVEEISWRSQYRKLVGRTITFGTKDKGPFEQKQVSKTMSKPTNNSELIWNEISPLFEEWWSDGKRVRFLSASLSNLVAEEMVYEQIRMDDLYNVSSDSKTEKNEIVNELNIRIGYEALATGDDYLNVKRFKDKRLVNRDSVKFNTWSTSRKK